VTSLDKPQGRKMIVTPPPVKVWAVKNNISCIQPEKLTKEEINVAFRSSSQAVDFFLVVAYGKIIPEYILNIPKLGSINIHYSLLPKYRGASPVETAILDGETETGVTIQQMELKMDSGPILAQEKTEILADEKASELRARLIKIGGELLVKMLPEFMDGKTKETVQDELQATFCQKIKKEDGLIDLNEDAVKNYNKFRAYATWPRTFFFKDGKRIIITKARLEDGKLVIEKVIPENGKEMDYKS
jgi:methionyl-tRNA formyltransferase